MTKSVDQFKKERQELNKLVLESNGQLTKRFFSLDSQAYREGEIPVKYKELMGLVASMVLRCDDCVMYHLDKCNENKVSTKELSEALEIAMIVGGSITIPHIRRAWINWQNIQNSK